MTTPATDPIKVLLVEDNPGDARLIFHLLHEVGANDFEIERVSSLEPALDRLSRAGVDAVLLDLDLPDSHGLETFTRTRAAAVGAKPIVVLTGLEDERVALDAIGMGAQDFLVKGRVDGRLLARVIRYAIERRRAEGALAASEAHNRTILENVADGVFVMDRTGRYLDVNPQACALTGYSRAELLTMGTADTHLAGERQEARDRIDGYAAGVLQPFERRMLRKDGSIILVEANPAVLGDGRTLTTVRDISDRRKSEEAIRASESRFRELAENVREVFFVMEPETGRALYVNPAYAEVFGHSREHAYATPHAWTEDIHPDDRELVLDDAGSPSRLAQFRQVVYRILRPDHSVRWIRARVTPINDEAGKILRIVGIAEDISDLRQAETQFLHSQKMEAVGRLAGGVAHDFNNVLTAILGYTEILLDSCAGNAEQVTDLTEIRTAGMRAAGLTRQLLAFSRQQVLQPMILDISQVARNLDKMLHPLLGDDVSLHLKLANSPGNIRADAGQLEQVIVNLAVNARDAMPGGGQLTIETAGLHLTEGHASGHPPMMPGHYVMLAVSDTGVGMDPLIQARIFEPFFTTKELGKGTGLGLSTVYGIVKQSGGFIWVYSEPGLGTTFKLYFPVVDSEAEPMLPPAEMPDRLHGTETILLAEDDVQLRRLIGVILGKLGYDVIESDNAESAERLAHQRGGAIDLLLTDVVMPGINGRELARRLIETRPAMRTLFMSGYSDAAIVNHGILEPGLNYLQKPFTASILGLRVRQVLDAVRGRSSGEH
ncbi:MAG: PAS domain S-box protein [Gemmatimonadota bacterium]